MNSAPGSRVLKPYDEIRGINIHCKSEQGKAKSEAAKSSGYGACEPGARGAGGTGGTGSTDGDGGSGASDTGSGASDTGSMGNEREVPLYDSLGIDARGVLDKGYHFGLIKLDCKTRSAGGVELSAGGVSNQETENVSGSVETTYYVKKYGLTLYEELSTDNILKAEASIQDIITEGLKLAFATYFAPQIGKKSAVLQSEFKNDVCALNCEVDLDSSGARVTTAAVLGYNGFLAGYQTGFDTQKFQITKNNIAFGYATGDFILHTNVDNFQVYGGSIFRQVNSYLEAAVQMVWSADANVMSFEIGCKYNIDEETTLRGKVDSAFHIGIGYAQKLREGITLTLSALIDGKNINRGEHKFGVALELEM